MFPLILDLIRKCRKRRENAVANHKQQCRLLEVLCNLNQKEKKVYRTWRLPRVFFSLLAYFSLKQMKQKRSLGNVT